jgi:cytochrome P450
MDEIIADKREELAQDDHTEGMDLVGQLVGSTMSKDAGGSQPKSSSTRPLTESEILGNLFIMLVAGHETSANVIHFSLVELAARPRSQRQLQRDIDAIFNGADPSEWTYDSVNALAGSMAGAAANETLRKMPPAIEIPKQVAKGSTQQTVTVDGTQHVLPEGISIAVCISSIQRNPRYWPSQPSKATNKPHDLDDWIPERWLSNSSNEENKSSTDSSNVVANDYAEDLGGYRGSDTSASLFRPERGAFIPFSDGARACLGRRFAQVEILAALAVVFREHSLELAVDQWATDAEVEAMDRDQRAALYARAQDECRKTLLKTRSVITLKLQGGNHVPVRLVKRGEERFVSWIE